MPAIIAVIILALLAVFQLALALGAPLGQFAWGGKERVLSPKLRRSSVVAIVLYAVFAVIILSRAGIIGLVPAPVAYWAMWVLVVYLFVGAVMNAISKSKPERFVMTPVALALAVLSLLVALG